MARFVGSVGRPPGTLSADCTFSTIELHPPCMYTTCVHILYAGAMIERPLGKRARLSLRNRETKLFSRLLYKLRFYRKDFRLKSMFLVDRRDDCTEEKAYVNRAIKQSNLSQSSVTAVRANVIRDMDVFTILERICYYNLQLHHYFSDYFELLFYMLI